MSRLALIGGHNLLESAFAAEASRIDVDVEGDSVTVADAGQFVALQRHGLDQYRAAHAIDHTANLRAVAALGCDRVLAIGSVGSLHVDLEVGSFVAPDDYIALHLGLPPSHDAAGHLARGFDTAWRAEVLGVWRALAGEWLVDGGVYWQTIGPRFETPAEIRLLAAHANVVGMTIASECIIVGELGLSYAAVCVVDNLANGVVDHQLTLQEFNAGRIANQPRLLAALGRVLPALEHRST